MATISVPITKGGKEAFLEIDLATIPEHVYAAFLAAGAKEYLNKGMGKVTKALYPDEKERQVAAMTIAAANLAGVNDGTIKIKGAKASKGVPGVVMTEARRIAKGIVKDVIKENGEKVSHYEASEITRMANQLIEDDPSIIEMATAAIEARKAKKPSKSKDIFAGIRISDKLVAKAEAKKKASKGTISAKQAGKVATRAKGEAHA